MSGTAIHLGDPADLWAGLEARFAPSGRPWRRPPGRPLRVEVPDPPSDPVEWTGPVLSFHESVADLLSHLFDYSVSPMVELDGPLHVSAGALMSESSLAGLEVRLGLDLTARPAAGYLLARLDGRRGVRYYAPEWEGLNRKLKIMHWMTPEGRSALARLRLGGMRHEGVEFHGDLTARQARRYLGYFQEMGTHIVRSITYGERLFQVFEIEGGLLGGVKDAFLREAGATAFSLAHFTRRPWVTKASPILSASDSPEAQRTVHHGIWGGEPGSLLSPGAMAAPSRAAVLATLPACSPVAVSFANQALYLEDFRADAWNRLMRAGLCQRFPGLRLAGWRRRQPFAPAPFLASAGFGSAGLGSDEALCKPPDPALPEIALVLDLTGSGRIAPPAEDCLALFAATDPGAGKAAEYGIDDPAFDPERVKIPFLDGALCLTDARDKRSCLVEGAWLGSGDDGRPSVVSDPAAPAAAALSRHVGKLSAYLRLIGLMQGPGFPAGADLATRRWAGWLAEAAVGEAGAGEAGLRWQALAIARGAGHARPPLSERAPGAGFARLLAACRELLALHPDSREFAAALQAAERQLHAFYLDQPEALGAGELDRHRRAAVAEAERQFADLGKRPDLPEPVAAVFAAGAVLSLPPDPHRTPHALVPGDDPPAVLWNALLGLRARHAECRSLIAAARGRPAEAADLLTGEAIDLWEAPADPAGDLLASCDIGKEASDRLHAALSALLALSRPAGLLRLAEAGRPEGRETVGPQLRRLLLVLEVLHVGRSIGMPLAPLDSLAPGLLAARIEAAVTALRA